MNMLKTSGFHIFRVRQNFQVMFCTVDTIRQTELSV